MWDFACLSLEMSIQLFFFPVVSIYFCSMLATPLPPSCFGTYSLSMSSPGCKAVCMVISFLVLRFICLSSSLVHFKNGPESLTRETVQVFIRLMKFLLCSLVLSCFPRSPEILFCYFFFHFHFFEGVRFQYSQVLVSYLFSKRFDFLIVLAVLFLPTYVVSHVSLLAWLIFLCQSPSLCPDYIFSLPV